jgi:hypothetical protein
VARYEIGFQSAAAAAGAAYAAFRAPTRNSKLLELGLSCNAATASNISLLRNTAAGYTATTSSSVGQQENPSGADAAGTSVVDSAWSTPPTVTAASRIRRFTLPATIGAGLIWTFQNGIWVRSATATDILVIWNEGGSAGSALNGYCVWEE